MDDSTCIVVVYDIYLSTVFVNTQEKEYSVDAKSFTVMRGT